MYIMFVYIGLVCVWFGVELDYCNVYDSVWIVLVMVGSSCWLSVRLACWFCICLNVVGCCCYLRVGG